MSLAVSTQVAQEGQHQDIRLSKKGAYKKHSGDFLSVKRGVQSIINALRLRWNPIKSPPILNVVRTDKYNMVDINRNTYDPYTLISKSALLNTDELYQQFKESSLALWRLRATKSGTLIRKLKQIMQTQAGLSIDAYKEQLRWLVQHSHPMFQLSWVSVMYLSVFVCICLYLSVFI